MKKSWIYLLPMLALLSCSKDETSEPTSNIPPLEAEMLPGGWPEPVVPNLNGAAAHFNTYVDFSSYWNSTAMNQFQRAGYKFVRMGAPWHDVETIKGVYSFRGNSSYQPGYDRAFQAFFKRGIRPIFCMGFGNTLYGQSQTVPITSEEGLNGFANYCKAMMKKYRDYNPIIEIWNEPNLSGFGSYTAEQYVELVRRCREAVFEGWSEGRNTEGLEKPLIIGPVVSNSWARGNMFDRCLDAGLLDVVDGVSYHPYTDLSSSADRRIPENIVSSTVAMKEELARRGRPDFPIVFTEWGWSTSLPTTFETGAIDYETQAKYHVRMLIMGYYIGININCIYSLDDARNEEERPNILTKHYGMFSTTGENFHKMLVAKPSVAAVTKFTDSLRGCAYVERVDMGDEGDLDSSKDWCLVFRNPLSGEAKVAVWTVESGVKKTSPDLMPLLGLSKSVVVEFTDMPVYVPIEGYVPPQDE